MQSSLARSAALSPLIQTHSLEVARRTSTVRLRRRSQQKRLHGSAIAARRSPPSPLRGTVSGARIASVLLQFLGIALTQVVPHLSGGIQIQMFVSTLKWLRAYPFMSGGAGIRVMTS